jgi:hypothetical protein
MDYSYPLLRKVTGYYEKIPHNVKGVYLLCCQHLLEPQMHMFDELIRFGFSPEKILILGKAYSTNGEILFELNKMGIRAIQPAFSGTAFDEEHKNNCRTLMEMVPSNAGCVLLDDGAELINLFLESGRKPGFAVEQTSSGFRKLEGKTLLFPVLNVARSTTKLVQESPLIARHAFERIRKYFEDKAIPKPKILIVGLGPIGEALREVFGENAYDVSGFDIKDGHVDLVANITSQRSDVIIGATGTSILNIKELEGLPQDKQVYLISMSSSDREFPVAFCREGKTETHIDITYRNLTFVNNGFPISFMGNRLESTPVEMEKTMCLLGGAVMYGATMVLTAGLLELPEDLERLINE